MNSVILIGRLTQDVDLRFTEGTQTAVGRFNIAIDRGKDKNGQDRGADFPRVTVFGKQAESCQKYIHKGSKVAIQGRIQTGQYLKDGKTVYTTDVVADRVEFLDSKAEEPDKEQEQVQVPEFAAIKDDVPF